MPQAQHLRQLTPKDVEQWAGPDLAFRARSYVRRVDDLRLGPDGQLLGWVEGSSRYVTQVSRGAAGNLQSTCTCGAPNKTRKHAAAGSMKALFTFQDGKDLLPAEADDIRLGAGMSFLPIEKVASHGTVGGALSERVIKRLTALKKGQLVDLLIGLAEDNAEIATLMSLRLDPKGRAGGGGIAWLEDSLQGAAEHPGWKDPRSGEQFTPDYGPVERGLVTLVEQGGASKVVKLGETLCELANHQLSETEDDGETRAAIVECVAVVLAALERSSLDPVERVCWYWDRLLDDPYHLFQGLDQPDELESLQPAQWCQVARNCRRRLQDLPGPGSHDDWRLRHQRRGLLDFATRALELAGEQEAATALLIAELPYTGNYLELVDHLISHAEEVQARDWALRGFAASLPGNPAESWRLVDRLVAMAEAQGAPASVAALRVEQFLHHPTLDGYRRVNQADPTDWPRVREGLLQWLASGTLPGAGDDWPLPSTGLDSSADPHPVMPPCLHFALLIANALDEGDNPAAVHWYRQAPPYANQAELVAERVRDSHPEVTLEIWSAQLERLIQQARTGDYARVRPYLEGIDHLYRQLQKPDAGKAFFTTLRRRHHAKRRLLELIDAVRHGQQRAG